MLTHNKLHFIFKLVSFSLEDCHISKFQTRFLQLQNQGLIELNSTQSMSKKSIFSKFCVFRNPVIKLSPQLSRFKYHLYLSNIVAENVNKLLITKKACNLSRVYTDKLNSFLKLQKKTQPKISLPDFYLHLPETNAKT